MTMSNPLAQLSELFEKRVAKIEDIHADYKWNGRSSIGDDVSGGPEDQHRFEDLTESLIESGQDTPLKVRPRREGGFELIAGFRRYSAARRIYADGKIIKGLEPGTIKIDVQNLDDVEALALNGRENIAREGLPVPDVMLLVWRLRKMGLSDESIGRKLGISTTYANQLRNGYKALVTVTVSKDGLKRKNGFDYWRERPYALTKTQVVSLVKIPEEERDAEFKRLLGERELGRQRCATNLAKGYRVVGSLVRLEAHGLIKLETDDWLALFLRSVPTGLREPLTKDDERRFRETCERIARDERKKIREEIAASAA